MADFRCPWCGVSTRYRAFSGGNEYTCDGPEKHEGIYPAVGEGLPRATLLRTPEGTEQLRADMQTELARRSAED